MISQGHTREVGVQYTILLDFWCKCESGVQCDLLQPINTSSHIIVHPESSESEGSMTETENDPSYIQPVYI